jgi:hypothetical protein
MLAGVNVHIWDVTDSIQALVRSVKPVDKSRLADPRVPLELLLDGWRRAQPQVHAAGQRKPPGGPLLWGNTTTRVSLSWHTDGPDSDAWPVALLMTWTGWTVAAGSSTSCSTTSPAGIPCRG